MTIYIIAFALSIGLYALFSKRPFQRNRIHEQERTESLERRAAFPFVISAAPLVLVSGLRYNVGTDYFNTYYTGFYRILLSDNFDRFEIGYTLLVKLIQLFTDNVFVLFFITSLIIVGFTFAAFRRMSSNVAFSILLFMITRYYFIGMNGVRQMMACAIFSYAFIFAINRNLKRYFIFGLIAVSFHYSTLLLFPTYWLMNIDWSPKKTIILLAASGAFGTVAFPLLMKYVPSSSKVGVILSTYHVAGTLFTIGTIALNIFILYVYFKLYRTNKHKNWYRCFTCLQIIATVATLLLPSIPSIERIYWVFSFPSIVCLPSILNERKPNWVRTLVTGTVVIVFTLYMFYDIGVLQDHMAVPYESVFGHEPVQSTAFDFRYTHGLDRWLR